MRTLLILRHGEAETDASFNQDHHRRLTERGRSDARRVGEFLRAITETPDSIICSTAARARETVESAVEAGDWKCPIRFEREVYESSPLPVLDHVQRETDITRRLLLAGHEPTCSALARLLAACGPLPFPPAALACLAFDVESWADAAPGQGRLLWVVTPKSLRQGGWERFQNPAPSATRSATPKTDTEP